MDFDGKVLLATGGASGLAAATARRFTAHGGRVALLDLDQDKAASVARDLDGAIAVGCDVADERAVQSAVARTVGELGRVDCALNAAGHVVFGPIEDYALDDFTRMLAVHVAGTFLVCRGLVPVMRAAGGGAIVNVGSIAGLVATPGNGAYSAAKGAIHAYTRQLAHDLAPDGIRVNAVAPGRVRTGMTEPLYTERGDGDFDKGAQLGARRNMQKRIAVPEEIAALICFLLSDDAGFLTGSIHVADGGETAQ